MASGAFGQQVRSLTDAVSGLIIRIARLPDADSRIGNSLRSLSR
jgi:hypothetical protein